MTSIYFIKNHDSILVSKHPSDKSAEAILSKEQCLDQSIEKALQIISEGIKRIGLWEEIPTAKGLYYVLKETHTKRVQEIGLRMALIFEQAFPHYIPEKEMRAIKEMLKKVELSHAGLSEDELMISQNGVSHPVITLSLPPLEMKHSENELFKQDFLRRIPKQTQVDLTTQMLQLKPASLEQIKAFKNGEWEHPIYKEDKWLDLAFRAFLDRFFDEMTMAKLCLYQQCVQESPVRAYQLMDEEGILQEESVRLLEKGLAQYFNADDKLRLREEIAKLLAHDGQFFAVNSPIFKESEESIAQKIESGIEVDIMAYFFFLNKHTFLLIEEEELQLVVPPLLLQAILRSKFGANAMQPNPVLGFFKKDVLSHPEKRIVAIPSPFAKQPKKVHDFVASGLGLYHHDAAYHLYIESSNIHRKAWIELAQLQDLNPSAKADLLDREFSLYARPESHQSAAGRDLVTFETKFWYSLAMFWTKLSRDNRDADAVIKKILDHIKENDARWKQDHGIDIASLESSFKEELAPGIFSLSTLVKLLK